MCACMRWCSPLAAGTQQQQHGDQQQDSEGAEGDGQNQLPTAQPRRHIGSSCHPRPDNTRLRPPPHSSQHRSHDASHRRGHRTRTSWRNKEDRHKHLWNLGFLHVFAGWKHNQIICQHWLSCYIISSSESNSNSFEHRDPVEQTHYIPIGEIKYLGEESACFYFFNILNDHCWLGISTLFTEG